MVSSRTRPGSREFEALVRSAAVSVTFVQVARAAVLEHTRLTLVDLEPTTVWLTHGEEERVGHMATGTFLDLWWHPDSTLASAALRGVLGRADPEVQLLGDPVLRVRNPRISGSGLRYDVEVLSGALAPRGGACVLFLGPGDVAGAMTSSTAPSEAGNRNVQRPGRGPARPSPSSPPAEPAAEHRRPEKPEPPGEGLSGGAGASSVVAEPQFRGPHDRVVAPADSPFARRYSGGES